MTRRTYPCGCINCDPSCECEGECATDRRPGAVTVPLPWRVPPLRANDRRSWPAQHRAFQQALTEARWAVKAANLEPVVGANVTLHYRPRTRQVQDSDGIAPTLKPVLDALVHEGILPGDNWVHVPRTSQEIHPPSDEGPALWLTLDPPDGEEFMPWEVEVPC